MKPLLTAALLLIGAHNTSHSQNDLLLVLPLDTAVVAVDSGASATLAHESKAAQRARRPAVSPAAHIARVFHPVFGDAIAHAARGVEVVDSSAATRFPASPASPPTETKPGMSVIPRDADSSRYVLTLDAVKVTRTTRTVARRTVPRSQPDFNPTTGLLTPGVRRSYSEGPGRMTTLTATASWRVWDHAGDSALVTGEAVGTTVFRGTARRTDWEAAARVLALDLLRRTPFTPDDTPPAAIPGKNAP